MRHQLLSAIMIGALVMASMAVVAGCYSKHQEEPKQAAPAPAESAAPPAESAAPPAAPAAPAAPPAEGGGSQ
jgi:hypothetical protein